MAAYQIGNDGWPKYMNMSNEANNEDSWAQEDSKDTSITKVVGNGKIDRA